MVKSIKNKPTSITTTFYFVVAVCLMSFMSSCKKYLDAKPDKTLTTPTTITALQAILDQGQNMNSVSPSFGEASADNYYMPMNRYSAANSLRQAAYTWSVADRNDYIGSNDWADQYFIVYNSNTCLEQISKIQRTNSNAVSWDNIKGSALFFRGRTFMHLAWLFCKAYDEATSVQDLGIPLRLNSDFNVPSVRASVEETYNRIISDLKESIPYLPNLPQHVFRPSKAAAYAYLSRTYLSMRKYDSAYKYADLCLQIQNVLMDYNSTLTTATSTQPAPNSTQPFKEFNIEVIHHFSDGNLRFSNISQSNARIDSNLYNSYSANDLRKIVFFIVQTDGKQFKGTYSGKYGTWFTGPAVDEIYLIRAECSARLGQTTSAMSDLNTVLVKRWKTGTFSSLSASNSTQALGIILTERGKELVMRDLRWADIKRLNKEGANISITRVINGQSFILPANDDRFALPLPTDIINITSMAQNPQ